MTPYLLSPAVVSFGVAEEPGALSESGGASAAATSEEHRRLGSAAVRPVVQTLLRWLPARVQPLQVSSLFAAQTDRHTSTKPTRGMYSFFLYPQQKDELWCHVFFVVFFQCEPAT